ncbi:MAG: AAA family ATPase [Pseudomonadota bacterium]
MTSSASPRIIAVANQKGGVGKTTTAVNLATALAAIGQRVVLVDLDPQGNASTGLGLRRADIKHSVYNVLIEDVPVQQAIVPTKVKNLSLLPSSINLSGADIELVALPHRELRLRHALSSLQNIDYVLIDCPPSLSLLTLNAFSAAASVLVPLQCEFYALEGLSQLVKTIERVRATFNASLSVQGVVLTMYDPRNRLTTQVAEDVRSYFGDKVYKTVIPRNVRLSEAPSFGLPAIVYDIKCTGSVAYLGLAKEVVAQERRAKRLLTQQTSVA